MNPIQTIKEEITTLQDLLAKLLPYENQLEDVVKPSFYVDYIDFNYPTRESVIKILLALGGSWAKTIGANKNTITYTRTEPLDGMNLRIWCGAPPPSCRIVKVIKQIPETLVPAHEETCEELICTGETLE